MSGTAAAAHRSAGSQTLERGLRVLRTLAAFPDGLSVSQLAAALATHRAGIYRLLGPLLEERLVVRDEVGRYALGIGLVELAGGVRSRLREVAVPELQRLADELAATTALTVRDGEEAVVLAVLAPRTLDLHLSYRPGLRHRLDRAAPGIAILSALPPRRGERRQVEEARARGWSSSSGELLLGATGVGAPIVVPGQEVEASISAVWIAPRDLEEPGRAVVRTAAAIAAKLR